MFEIYSKYGRKIGDAATLAEARRKLRTWEQASYVIEGRKVVLKKNQEPTK